MEPITLQEILTATGGTLLEGSQDLSTAITAVDTDSRAMAGGSLFVPLVGERFDGHAYIESALTAAAGTLTQRPLERYAPDRFYVLVEDTMQALGDLARYYRHKFQIKVVGITGSVGKTTCKDMVASVLSARFRVLKTDGNFNNNIGVPKTLFRLDSSHEIAVIEMGMNHPGEIDYLTNIVNPDVAVITNIGDAHIENLGSRENTLKAKSEIFNGMKGKGVAVLNGDDPLLSTLSGKLEQQILWYGWDSRCDFGCADLDEGFDNHVVMDVRSPQGQWRQAIPGLGSHMIYPALAAVAVGSWFGMTTEEIHRGILNFVPTKMRMDRVSLPGGVTVLNDTYNANPQSMRSAVEVLSKTSGSYKVAVLGDMLELGELGPALHESVGRFVGQCGIDCLLAVGDLAEYIYNGAMAAGIAECYTRPNKEEAKVVLEHILRPGCTILCKASRGMRLEELVDYIETLAASKFCET
ncbi:MAG: UDP-N-acetylmuramoyl-tripeptide--D-alanyl-D-alanine ligase [Clostridiales bacterium]|nr:UDP-N-acetylmuramoyl-tripeptide--D-alanyl-D-alanine ligase [Clostridiales bacterium]